MNKKEFIEDLKNELESYIVDVMQNGWTLSSGQWIDVKDKTCCALGAGIVKKCNYKPTVSVAVDSDFHSCVLYQLHSDEVYSIADGFDNQPYDSKKHHFGLWKLGRDLAVKWILKDEAPVTIPDLRV